MRKALCIILAFAICSLSIFSYVYAEENISENQANTQDTNNTNNESSDLKTKQEAGGITKSNK